MIPYEDTMDRETLNHFIRYESKGPFFGVVLETADVGVLVRRLSRRLKLPIHQKEGLVFFSGPLSETDLRYLNAIDVKRKILVPGSYAAFAGNPEHWLKQYAGFGI